MGFFDAMKSDGREQEAFSKGSETDITYGPVKDRRCTDIPCVALFLAHLVVFIIVTLAGVANGDPSKLYKPRDFRGNYCGAAKNWNNGPDLESQTHLTYTMNVTETTDQVAKQLLCSTASSSALRHLLAADAYDDYLCACCLAPCASCIGSLDLGGDLSLGNIGGTISARMADLTDPANAGQLFSPSGANGDLFTEMWGEATKYFNQVCLPDCNTDSSAINGTAASQLREYVYTPSPDSMLRAAWDELVANGPAAIKSTISSSFTYSALPSSVCPYDAEHCVPFPGVRFQEVSNRYCSFEMAADVVDAVGQAAADTFGSLGADAFAESMTSSFGSAVGDFMDSIDTFFVVAVLSFVIGIVFLVILRFFIGCCVWAAILSVLLILVLIGSLCFVRAGQCRGAGLFASGQQQAVAVTVASAHTLQSLGSETASEAMTGDGADYRGVQQRTRSGLLCQAWDAMTPQVHNITSENYPDDGLVENYCRNPYDEDDRNKASTIWCFTTDPETRWELCTPIGMIHPECTQGYAVHDEDMREALKIIAYIFWGLGALWLLLVFCMQRRIRLAIGLNKVGAKFVMDNATVILVPICQVAVGTLWVVLWFFAAAFLLSQVPDGYTPKGYYATYAEAYGVDAEGMFAKGTPGACTDKWPVGFVWKDNACEADGEGLPKCWRCGPPRYVLDTRFAISFFSFLWNNAFIIAVGQCLIAGAVGAWFFTPNEKKGKTQAVRIGTYNVFRYHLGSVAFGALIIAIVQFIRYTTKYLEKQAAAKKNKMMVMILKALQCCIWCIEKCLKFLNKNAYIQIALLGTNFCTSAKRAFFLILRNAARFATVAVLLGVIQWIGFLCIMVSTAVVGYVLTKEMHPEVGVLFPLFVYVCLGYVVGKCFMNVFGLAVDASLHCFLAAEEMGHVGDFIPGPLTSFFSDDELKKDPVERWAEPVGTM